MTSALTTYTYPPSYFRRFCLCLALLAIVDSQAAGQFFVDRAQFLGLEAVSHANGVSVADFDLDGDLDLFVVATYEHDPGDPSTWNRLYRNDGPSGFTDVSEVSGINQTLIRGYGRKVFGNGFSAAWADYDRDGDPDLILTHVGPEVLLRNNGDGTFTDVSESSGINAVGSETDSTETAGATWWDYDLDGDLDLYLSNWNGPNRLHRNEGDGTFEEVGATTGTADPGHSWSALPLQANDDRWPDLYVVNDFGRNTLFVGKGDGTFRDETESFRLNDTGDGMGIASGDINGDALLDLYVTNVFIRGPNPLFVNTGQQRYEDAAAFLGIDNADWAWGTEFFDADHDGDVDLYAVNGHRLENGTPNRFWMSRLVPANAPGFTDRSTDSGAGSTEEGRGLVVFDYDRDGDLDMAVSQWNAPLLMYENRLARQNWIKLRLKGVQSNTDGYGAIVRLWAGGLSMIRSYDGVDFNGQSPTGVHFGLGSSAIADSIHVRWPSGRLSTFASVSANQELTIVEDAAGTSVAGNFSQPAESHALQAFPNPADAALRIENVPIHASHLELINVLGQVALQVPLLLGRSSFEIDVSGLRPGLYFLRVIRPSGRAAITSPILVR